MSFGKDFVWGVSTAAYQIEGAASEGGRTPSIWDVYSHTDGKCFQNQNGDIACDHYHRYREDVALMSELGTRAYRFSISWSRVIPNGTGAVNPEGISFYSNLVDELLAHGITPYVTLYHWDMPEALHQRGGWQNPESPEWFEAYTEAVVRALGDRVKHWMTINEPICFVGGGYIGGNAAPGYRLPRTEYLSIAHHVLLAHGRAVKKIRLLCPDAKVGFAFNGSFAFPVSNTPQDIEAARRYHFEHLFEENPVFSTSWFADPMILGRYPEYSKSPTMAQAMPEIGPGDMELIAQPLDFYGINLYKGVPVSYNETCPDGIREHFPPVGQPYTSVQWPVTPQAIYWSCRLIYERYHLPILITENGVSLSDMESRDGKVHDPSRIEYTARYLSEVGRAIDEGIDICGYFHWSFLDNFEWGGGYVPRFGLVYVDYPTQRRIPKDSFYWYRDVIASSGEKL